MVSEGQIDSTSYLGPTILVIFGIPGAGKTTLAEQISARLRIPLLSSDVVGLELWRDSKIWQAGTLACADLAMQVVFGLLGYWATHGNPVVIDAAMTGRRRWDELHHVTAGTGANLLCLLLDCPQEVALHRINARQRAGAKRHYHTHSPDSLAIAKEHLHDACTHLQRLGARFKSIDATQPQDVVLRHALDLIATSSGDA